MAEQDLDLSTLDFSEPSDTLDLSTLDFSDNEGDKVITEDSLTVDPTWLKHARTVYESENKEPYKKSNDRLAEWFKNRHSEIGVDLTSMMAQAGRTASLSDKAKSAWLETMPMYTEMKTDWRTVARNAKNMVQDPTLTLPLFTGVGIAATGSRIIGARAASIAGKTVFKEQLKKALAKRKIPETAIQEIVKTGSSPTVSKQIFKQARKEAAKATARWQGGTAGLWGGVAAGYGEILEQQYDRDKQSKGRRDRILSRDLDLSDVGEQAAIWGLGGALTIGAGGRLWSKFRQKKQLDKYSEIIETDERLLKEQAARKKPTKKVDVPLTAQNDEIKVLLDDTILELKDNGTLRINITGTVTQLTKQLTANKMAVAKQKLSKGKKLDKEAVVKIKKEARSEAKKIAKETEHSVKNYADVNGIALSPKVTRGKKGAKIGVVLKGKKVAGGTTTVAQRLPDGRSIYEELWAKISRKFGGQRTQAITDLHRIQRGSTDAVLKGAARRIGQLEDALAKQFNVKNMRELDDLDENILIEATDKLKGKTTKTYTFSPEVIKELEGMRKHISILQKDLLDTGLIKKGTDVDIKIKQSMDKAGNAELYLTRQYEIFDNPKWTNFIKKHPKGIKVANKAREFLKERLIDADRKTTKTGRLGRSYLGSLDKRVAQKGLDSLMPEEKDYWLSYMGEDGVINQTIDDILASYSEDDLWRVFGSIPKPKNSAGKIIVPKKDIPQAIRALMGEYTDPFTNYRNSVMKINQLVETYKYADQVADLIKAGLVPGASRAPVSARGQITEIGSLLPQRSSINDPFKDVKEFGDVNFLGGSLTPKSPLDKLYATKEVADAIIMGNEIARNIPAFYQKYLLLQGHTRAAKTVFSPVAIVRNFLGAGWMAIGAGYMNPRFLKEGWNVGKDMLKQGDAGLRAEIEKQMHLGINQSGIEVGTYREVLKLVSEPDFFLMRSPYMHNKKSLVDKAKQLNISATKFYQSMDDMWKAFAFHNEKRMNRQIMIDQGKDPDKVVQSFLSGDDVLVEITALDKLASSKVAQHMQNYAGVPQFVRSMRLLPMADFLAFTTELARTQYHIWKTSLTDIREGAKMMRESENPFSGTAKGRAQFDLGMHRLGSVIAAQSAAPALAATSATALGMDEKLKKAKYTIKQGLEFFDADFDKGSDYSYFFFDKPDEKGQGKRVNISYVNPWAQFKDPIIAGLQALKEGENIDDKIFNAMEQTFWEPVRQTLGPSMLAASIADLWSNTDRYRQPIFTEGMTKKQKLLTGVLKFLEPFEPGVIKLGRDIHTSLSNVPAGKEYGVKEGKTLRKREFSDEMWGLSGFKPKHYNISQSLGFKIGNIKNKMSEAGDVFKDAVREQAPMNIGELVDAYTQSLEKEYSYAKDMYDVFEHARSAGMSDRAIINAITKDGLFNRNLDKALYRNLMRGIYTPKPPVTTNIKKWVRDTENQGGSPPPLQEARKDLMIVYNNFRNAPTKPVETLDLSTLKF